MLGKRTSFDVQTFYDLFAGVGGFRLGLEKAGFRCVGSCEIDKHARSIYQKHFGETPDLDATKLDAGAMPDFDILAAGFPCQAFSLAGKRLGFEDTRGTLFFEIARIARQKRPGILFLENVEGLLFHDEGRTFGTILIALDELGYDVEWQVINGKYFLPQSRKRVFIIGHARGKSTLQVFPLRSTAAAAQEGDDEGTASARCIDANYWKGMDNHEGRTVLAMTEARTIHAKSVRREMQKQGKDYSGRRDEVLVPRPDNNMNCITATPSKEHIIAIPVHDAKYQKRTAWGKRFGEHGEPFHTLTGLGFKEGIYDGLQFRTLTPLECERLQGFPDGWTEGISERARFQCIGNAVMPPVVEYIARNF